MLGAHLPQHIKEPLKGCCCLKEWHIQNPSCFAGLLWIATYSNLQQDVFYKRVNLARLFKWEAFERLHVHTHTTEKDLDLPSTLTSLLDGHQHPCTWGLPSSHSSRLLCVSKCVGPLCSETAWGSRSRGDARPVRPAVSALSGTMARTRCHREKRLKPWTVLLVIKQLAIGLSRKDLALAQTFLFFYYMVGIRCSWSPNQLWVQVLGPDICRAKKNQLKRSIS